MAEKYILLHQIGSGTYGTAWLAGDKNRRHKCVVKVIKVRCLSDQEIEQCLTEVSVLARCCHDNIIHYVEAYVAEGALNIAMEYAEGGDLQRKIVKQQGIFFSKDLVLDWFVQICLALKYIHSKNILHRDLKSQNVFLTSSGKVKLGDFGIAKILQDQQDHALTTIGTPFYISPEICQKKPYNSKSDMWAAGCVLYEMCCLRVPFNAPDFTGLVLKILQGRYMPVKHFGPFVDHLLSKLLEVEPDKRLSAESVLDLPELQRFLSRHKSEFDCERSRSKSEYGKYDKIQRSDLQEKTVCTKLGSSSSSTVTTSSEQTNSREEHPVNCKNNVKSCNSSSDSTSVESQGKEIAGHSSRNSSSKSETYTVTSPLLRRISQASPQLKETVRRQRQTLSEDLECKENSHKNGEKFSLLKNVVKTRAMSVADSKTKLPHKLIPQEGKTDDVIARHFKKANSTSESAFKVRCHSVGEVDRRPPSLSPVTHDDMTGLPALGVLRADTDANYSDVFVDDAGIVVGVDESEDLGVHSKTFIIRKEDVDPNNNISSGVPASLSESVFMALSLWKTQPDTSRDILQKTLQKHVGLDMHRLMTCLNKAVDRGQSYQNLAMQLNKRQLELLPIAALHCVLTQSAKKSARI